ncbi:uncharacterized protein EV154DRAFT_566342 [Mucor mucedo]|uniref:uncharacterized protein n=1 Tax=Mucor mucedo TaxID=29922 RepID=UPI00221E5CC8|nr:uncharacterized protein EV154DRAFT_566342 [Mucor mucedo]KAI7888461.1 hypothetical protein EV154DRAFT_566342 [Mucor mucedo]
MNSPLPGINPSLPAMPDINSPAYLNILDPLDVASQSAAKALAAAESARAAAPKPTVETAAPTPETNNVVSETSNGTPLHINNVLIMAITLVLLVYFSKTLK